MFAGLTIGSHFQPKVVNLHSRQITGTILFSHSSCLLDCIYEISGC
jgi:hypothetical protein